MVKRVLFTMANMATNEPSHQINLANLLVFLNEQKAHDDMQTDQIRALLGQVSTLIQNRENPLHPVTNHVPVVSELQLHPNPLVTLTPVTAPHVLTRAAANLTADLQSGLGQIHNFGYSGLTIDSLRSNPGLVSQANQMLTATTQNVPPLNPVLGGMEAATGTLQSSQVIRSILE